MSICIIHTIYAYYILDSFLHMNIICNMYILYMDICINILYMHIVYCNRVYISCICDIICSLYT